MTYEEKVKAVHEFAKSAADAVRTIEPALLTRKAVYETAYNDGMACITWCDVRKIKYDTIQKAIDLRTVAGRS